ncbi:MAG: hypothetical protein RLZZ330_762 [Actinomycetota bacterium]|jgi:3-oxoacyl-[acyl-carrier-protein] synthase-3
MSAKIKGRAHRFSKVTGLGVYRPTRVVSNEEICQNIESSDEWIRERTGIIERRFAEADISIIDMATAASEKAIADAGLTANDIDGVILATISHALQTPAAATMVADRLGLNNPAASDISAACAGFSYGIAIADSLVSSSQANNVLVIGVEKLSDWTDKHDRGAAFIFADGAGAVVVSASDTPEISPTVWGSDGSDFDAIISEPNWLDLRNPERTKAQGDWPVLRMQGQKVFRWAVGQMPAVCGQILEAAGLTPKDIDLFVPHQANLRITKAIVKALDFPETVKIATDIETAGNTSAASIPLALDRMRQEGVAKSGDLALLVGFGAGLAYAGQVIRIP